MNLSSVWVEKYRPKSIAEVLLQENVKQQFESFKEVPNNLLLIGSPGIGKSTVAKILAKTLAPYSYLYINASEQGNIETVRTLISDFISVQSIDGNQKIVILDEADGVSLVAQQALRSIMEEYLDSVKFILTANYKNKIIEALRSRCQEFMFTCSEKQILVRIVEILKKEKITVDKNQVSNLKNLLKKYFPDIRKTINEVQKCCSTGSFEFQEETNDFVTDLQKEISDKTNVFTIRTMVLDNSDKFGNDFHSLMKQLFDVYVKEKNVVASLLISEYMYRHAFVLDAEVNFSALLFQLNQKL